MYPRTKQTTAVHPPTCSYMYVTKKVWVDLHKVPFSCRAPDLGPPLYERLLDVAIRRAQCAFVWLSVVVVLFEMGL